MSQAISGLCSLYWLNMELSTKLQVNWRINYQSIYTYIPELTEHVCAEPGAVGSVYQHGAEYDPSSGR